MISKHLFEGQLCTSVEVYCPCPQGLTFWWARLSCKPTITIEYVKCYDRGNMQVGDATPEL